MELYDYDATELRGKMGIDVPAWIRQDIDTEQVAAIIEGGCASGAYMPAVTYHEASATMAEHGDDVLQFICDELGDLPTVPNDTSWSGLACLYLSTAVELWAQGQEENCLDWFYDKVDPR